eukprot:CAMPEP_0185850222 /NCGR_PEP_ID=MMETSP1354-20130828/4439_1 /TAXON_ID=708628 /ORGANISM="Erythrolobus madagascarensis, Strain CCMP3276" /LENGTH=37 /DNA_ID= /DNA_START= /DNA_END= /DNA_ORIENTATION=
MKYWNESELSIAKSGEVEASSLHGSGPYSWSSVAAIK